MEGEERGLYESSNILGHTKCPCRTSSDENIIWVFHLCDVLLFSGVKEN